MGGCSSLLLPDSQFQQVTSRPSRGKCKRLHWWWWCTVEENGSLRAALITLPNAKRQGGEAKPNQWKAGRCSDIHFSATHFSAGVQNFSKSGTGVLSVKQGHLSVKQCFHWLQSSTSLDCQLCYALSSLDYIFISTRDFHTFDLKSIADSVKTE